MLAQNFDEIQKQGLPGFVAAGGGTVGTLIFGLLPYIYGIAGLLLLIYLVTGGLQLMISRGDPKAVQSAQGKITNAIIGIVIIAASFLIVRLIGQIFDIQAIKDIFQWI